MGSEPEGHRRPPSPVTRKTSGSSGITRAPLAYGLVDIDFEASVTVDVLPKLFDRSNRGRYRCTIKGGAKLITFVAKLLVRIWLTRIRIGGELIE